MSLLLNRATFESPTDAILNELLKQQHLDPQQPLLAAIEFVRESAGICPGAAGQAMRLLKLDASIKIGRLRKTQLVELAGLIRELCCKPRTNEAMAVA